MGHEANFDYILDNYVGGCGRYQLWNTICMGLVYYAGIYPLFNTVFTAYSPDHRCRVQPCESVNQTKVTSNIYDPEWLEFAIPKEISSSNLFSSLNKYDGCTQFIGKNEINPNVIATTCFPEDFSDNQTKKCEEFIYDNTYFDETLTTKLDLVCDHEGLNSLLGTILIIGLLFGSLIGGQIGDRFGRKMSCFAAIAIIVPMTIGAGHVESYNGIYFCLHFVYLFPLL
jgi:OCT family organic cation transporter-like MFS transporter 4/5